MGGQTTLNLKVITMSDDDMGTTQAITTTTTDDVDDPATVTYINQDKLHNVADKVIVEACEELAEIDEARAELNDRANLIRSNARKLGIPSVALNAAYARSKMDPKKRAEIDAAVAKCFKALDVAYQPGLF